VYTISSHGSRAGSRLRRAGGTPSRLGSVPSPSAKCGGGRASRSVNGKTFWLGAGLGIGPVPISGLAAIQVKEQARRVLELEAGEIARIEVVLR
jgi:hypothetical protein